jgi:hypothetical protein
MTAVEWLVEQFNSEEFIYRDRTNIIQQAKEMFERQIIDAYWEGCSNWDSDKDAEQYYNETFKNK